MKRRVGQLWVLGTDVDDCPHTAATIRLLRRALADETPGATHAERWKRLQQRIDAHEARRQWLAYAHAHAVGRHVCLFLRPRYSLGAPIM